MRVGVKLHPSNEAQQPLMPTCARVCICMCMCSGPSFLQALLRSARLGGNSAMVLRAALSAQADRVSKGLGVRSGVEMRAARRAAEAVGAQIVLGDRHLPLSPGESACCPLGCWACRAARMCAPPNVLPRPWCTDGAGLVSPYILEGKRRSLENPCKRTGPSAYSIWTQVLPNGFLKPILSAGYC